MHTFLQLILCINTALLTDLITTLLLTDLITTLLLTDVEYSFVAS
jgi:hypothetical protein